MIKSRTRQVRAFVNKHGRLPADVFELEAPPKDSTVLLVAACDRQEATIGRSAADPGRALLRVKLPSRPDPRARRDWSWVSVPLVLPPTVPDGAALHLPTLRIVQGKLRAEVPFTRPVPEARRAGHEIALGVDWGLNTLLSAGAARLDPDGTVTALGAGAQYRADGILAKLDRLRRHGEHLHTKTGQYERLSGGDLGHPMAAKAAVLREESRTGRRPPQAPERRPRLLRRPLDRRPGRHSRRIRDLPGEPCGSRGPRHGEDSQYASFSSSAGEDCRLDPPSRREGGHRGCHGATGRHLPVLPALPGRPPAPQGTRPPVRARLEMGRLPRLRLAGRPRHRRLDADRRPRPRPPGQDCRRPQDGHDERPRRRRGP
jgi:hypothetical protein